MPSHSFTNPEASYRRAIAGPFTETTRKHHPFLDLDLPDADIPLVPDDLAPRGGLSWVLPSAPGVAAAVVDSAPAAAFDVGVLRATMGLMRENLLMVEEWVVGWAEEGSSRWRKGGGASRGMRAGEQARSGLVSGDGSRDSDVETVGTPGEDGDLDELSGVSGGLGERAAVRRNRGVSSTIISGLSADLDVSSWLERAGGSLVVVESADPTSNGGPVKDQQISRACSSPTAGNHITSGLLETGDWGGDGRLVDGFTETGITEEDLAMLRSGGPYDEFWLRNNIYGHRKKRSAPELKRKAGSTALRGENRKSL